MVQVGWLAFTPLALRRARVCARTRCLFIDGSFFFEHVVVFGYQSAELPLCK